MRLLILTHYFPPEIGSPQAIYARWLPLMPKRGHEVTVVTCFPHYPDGNIPEVYSHRLFTDESWQGIRVLRTWNYATRNVGAIRRIADHTSFTLSCWRALAGLSPCDVVMTHSPPIPTALSGLALARRWRVPHVLNLNDLWVEVAIEMKAITNAAVRSALSRFSIEIQRRSDLILITAPSVRVTLESYGIPRTRIEFMPHPLDVEAFSPSTQRRKEYRNQLGWGEKTIVLYHGTLGMSQGLAHVVAAAALLSDRKDLKFVFVGDGAEKAFLMERARQMNVPSIEFHDPRPLSEMPGLLDACDIGVVSLRKLKVFQATIPYKLFEFMAAAKPVVIGAAGDALEVVSRADCGLGYRPENSEDLAAVIRALAENPARCAAMGQNGRSVAVEQFSSLAYVQQLEKSFAAMGVQ